MTKEEAERLSATWVEVKERILTIADINEDQKTAIEKIDAIVVAEKAKEAPTQ